MARWFSIKPGITFKGRKFKGLRGFAGKPFHPPLTDIPIGAYVLVAAFDLISLFYERGGEISRNFFNAGTYALVGGFIVSLGAALTGYWDWLKSTPKHTQARRTVNFHATVMLTATALVIVNFAERQDQFWASPVLTSVSVLIALLVSFGATYGGSLVFDYGFNVETSGDHPVWHESEEDVFPGSH
jgi:uncharacterized membrane protein